jgi:hypothetical protein
MAFLISKYTTPAFPNRRVMIILLGLVWLGVQLYLCQQYGVKIVPDSRARFIPYASAIAEQGYFALGHDIRYVGYTLFLAVFLKWDLSFHYVVLAQVLLSGIAAVVFFRLTEKISRSTLCAFVATFLFVGWPDIQYWNFYLLTESLFTSLLLISFYLLLRAKKGKDYALLGMTVLLTMLVRPNGFILLVAIAGYYSPYYWTWMKKANKLVLALLLLAFSGFCLLLLNQLVSSFYLVETYARGEIIYGSTEYALHPPADLSLPSQYNAPLVKLASFIWNHPLFFLQLSLLKGLFFIVYAKPYFSWLHILSIILTVYPLYFFTVKAFFNPLIRQPAHLFASLLIILQTLIIMLTVEDWDCRFTAPLLPFVFMYGMAGLFMKVKERQEKQKLRSPDFTLT